MVLPAKVSSINTNKPFSVCREWYRELYAKLRSLSPKLSDTRFNKGDNVYPEAYITMKISLCLMKHWLLFCGEYAFVLFLSFMRQRGTFRRSTSSQRGFAAIYHAIRLAILNTYHLMIEVCFRVISGYWYLLTFMILLSVLCVPIAWHLLLLEYMRAQWLLSQDPVNPSVKV